MGRMDDRSEVTRAAVRDARVVITMLPILDVVRDVIFDGGAAEEFAEGAAWAQMGTIGVAATAEIASRLGRLRPDVMFVDAPVSGARGLPRTGSCSSSLPDLRGRRW